MKKIKSFDSSHPLLYLIATPIGNLGEFSSRAIDIINEMDFIACEDTRNTKELLRKFDINKHLVSLREHNEVEMSNYVIKEILNGKKVAYVSDAGYPAISDPGNILVKIANENDIAISVVSGSSAFINALVSSNLDTDHFYFHGFLPAKEGEAKRELEELKSKKETLIFYESPHRIEDTLKIFLSVLGDREIVLHRELTKINEEKIYGTISELLTLDFNLIKGEIVLVVEGSKEEKTLSDSEIQTYVAYFVSKGMSKKDAIETVSDIYKVKKNYIKDLIK
ncbi:MAG: 16S rRNA (cytidine(1402)-2'-O)-methyltransferase [Bacilli bacterium]|nr:16S rRNA (cytidine(1402)-2'-O)-methyltransferase [Bacilli bacterium]